MASVIRLCTRNMATNANVIKHVTVIGGGLMGSGIAQVSVSYSNFFRRKTHSKILDFCICAMDSASSIFFVHQSRISLTLLVNQVRCKFSNVPKDIANIWFACHQYKKEAFLRCIRRILCFVIVTELLPASDAFKPIGSMSMYPSAIVHCNCCLLW